MNIITIFSIIFLFIIIIALIQFSKKSKKTEKLYGTLQELDKKIRTISKIKKINNFEYNESKLSSNHLNLKNIRSVFRYSHLKNEFWIDYIFENNTLEKETFTLDKVELNINGEIIQSNSTLLLEKVPKHLAPPYGNRYFSTNSYNNYTLGNNEQFFIFNSSFDFTLTENSKLTERDFVKIHITIFKTEKGEFQPIQRIEFIEYFKNLQYSVIQEIDEKIKWEQ